MATISQRVVGGRIVKEYEDNYGKRLLIDERVRRGRKMLGDYLFVQVDLGEKKTKELFKDLERLGGEGAIWETSCVCTANPCKGTIGYLHIRVKDLGKMAGLIKKLEDGVLRNVEHRYLG